MIRLQVKPAYRDLLQAHRLGSYAEIMQSDAGEIIEDNAERDVRRLRLKDRVLYLKRTRLEKIAPALESYARGKLAHSKPLREVLQFDYLERAGFDVAEVVASGEELRFGIPKRGFIMTAEVPGSDLSRVFESASDRDRRLLLGQFGELLGRLHDRGFYGSTRLKDVIYPGPPRPEAKLTLIDRETRNPFPRRASARRILERLLFNVRRQAQQGERFNAAEWQAFCESYCAALSGGIGIEADTVKQRILAMLVERGWLRA